MTSLKKGRWDLAISWSMVWQWCLSLLSRTTKKMAMQSGCHWKRADENWQYLETWHDNDVAKASWLLKSLTTPLFVQNVFSRTTKKIFNVCITGSVWGEPTSDYWSPVNPPHKKWVSMSSCRKVMQVNSLRPSGTIWWHRSGSTLAQVMSCCLMAPSHYLNQCWLIISMV